MEKLLRPYDKECMRMAMLKHEETFKEQVYELHRLYRIQKTLMKSIENGRHNGGFLQKDHNGNMHQNSRMRLDLERPAEEYNIAEADHGNRMLEVIDESEIELTLGPTRYLPRKKHGTPPTSDSGPSFSSSSTESSHMNRTSSMTKRKTSTTTEELSGRDQLGLFQVTDMTLGYPSGSKNNIDLEEQLRQERLKQPPWLFQVLSMNMT
ncbi:uncharacterized protein LOC110409107 [Herrania umbratica]|uniref:Uncharacterized protein LOC110409107 n=1 Tax=Herrania umbratica TaxID=108875 RepID=A0A6J0ZIK1_9ROSI|nr:uncharacterized protein LOC110409107 [Herrania umbratica]